MPHTHDLTLTSDEVRKRFVSVAAGEPDREWLALQLLHEHAPGLAPRPLAREPGPAGVVVVMSRLPGEPLPQAVPAGSRLSAAHHEALAEALTRLFAVPLVAGLPERANGPSRMRTDLRGWIAEDAELGPCQDARLVAEAVSAARQWLGDADPAHDRVVDPVAAVGDGNLDNVLWDGATCRLVDFEEFGVSDLAYELADVVEHVSARLTGALDAEELLGRFDLGAEQRQRLTHHRRLMACYWLVMLLPGHGGFRRNPPGSTEHQARHVLALLGLVQQDS